MPHTLTSRLTRHSPLSEKRPAKTNLNPNIDGTSVESSLRTYPKSPRWLSAAKGSSSGVGATVGLYAHRAALAALWQECGVGRAWGRCEAVRMLRGGAHGMCGCMACVGDACRGGAREIRGTLGERLSSGPRRTSYAAGGLLLSTMCRRRQLDTCDKLVRIQADEQDVKKSGVDRQKPTSS